MSEQETAQPQVTDTGTFFAEMPVCTNCHQAIERIESIRVAFPAPLPARAWVHIDSRSIYCHDRGDQR